MGCDDLSVKFIGGEEISTHTSRVGCDLNLLQVFFEGFPFLLTHPVWDVTTLTLFLVVCCFISTHTSRVGCDS